MVGLARGAHHRALENRVAAHRAMPVRLRYLALAAVLVVLGVATKMYSGPGAGWIGGNLGGAVYVMFWTYLASAVWPELSVGHAAVVVLVCTSALEFLQLWHPPVLEAARRTLAGQAVLGSHFSWIDFPYYIAGALAAGGLGRYVGSKESGSHASL